MEQSKLLPFVQDFFQKHLLEERGLSANTMRSYRDATKDFLKHICKTRRISAFKLEPKMFTAEALRSYLNSLEKNRSLSIGTRNQRLAALKTLLMYLAANDLDNLTIYQSAAMVSVKRGPHRTIDYFTDNEMKEILAIANRADKRHRLLIALLYNTGGRVSEICDLCFEDIVFGPPPSVYITGKGNKRRQVPIWPQTANLLSEELSSRGSEQSLKERVILNDKGNPMTRFGALYVVKAIAEKATEACPSIKYKQISPHVIRHTTAMHLLQSGVDLSVIRMWLGHVNLNTTHDYVELDVEMKRQALQQSKKLKPGHDLKKAFKKHRDVIEWLESL
jgi:integrase/recombinase XerD